MAFGDLRDRVKAIPIIHGLDPRLRDITSDILVDVSNETNLSQGDLLYEKGAEDKNSGLLLLEGDVAVRARDGREIQVSAPELLGEMQQLSPFGQRTATVVAKSDIRLLKFSWHEFVERLIAHPSVSEDKQIEIKSVITKLAGARLKELIK